MGDQREWHLRVARGATEFSLPDPTRWHTTTQLYRRVAEALCAGDLSRGAQLLDQAVAAERAAFDTVPVQIELPSALAAPSSTPEERPFIAEGESCPTTKAPGLFQRADAILRMTDTSAPVANQRNRPNHHWWDAPEEEAEAGAKKDVEKGEKAGGQGKDAARAPAEAEVEQRDSPEKEAEEEVGREREVARAGSTASPALSSAPQRPPSPPPEGQDVRWTLKSFSAGSSPGRPCPTGP